MWYLLILWRLDWMFEYDGCGGLNGVTAEIH